MLAPPSLVEPLNLAPIINEKPKITPVHFEWKAVPDAVSYTLRVSTTTSVSGDCETGQGSGDVGGYRRAGSGGIFLERDRPERQKGKSSEVSENFQFTLVAQGKSQDMLLEIDGTQLHGRVAEIVGRTEPGAALIVNGQSVPNIASDGTFRHFTEPLEPGSTPFRLLVRTGAEGRPSSKFPLWCPSNLALGERVLKSTAQCSTQFRRAVSQHKETGSS